MGLLFQIIWRTETEVSFENGLSENRLNNDT